MTTIISKAGPGQELGRFPRSPAKGKAGRELVVNVNLFIFKRYFTGTVSQYDIEIEPRCPRNLSRAVFEKFGQTHFAGLPVAYDGNKIAFAGKSVEMSPEGIKSEVPHPEGGRKPYTVTMRLASLINMQELVQFMARPDSQQIPPSQLQVLEVVVKALAATDSVTIGANRFFSRSNSGRQSIGGGLDCASGNKGISIE